MVVLSNSLKVPRHDRKGDHKDRPYAAWVKSQVGTAPGSLGRIIQALKSISAVRVYRANRLLGLTEENPPLWHRNYHDRVIRDEDELERVRDYIKLNPLRWTLDALYHPAPRSP